MRTVKEKVYSRIKLLKQGDSFRDKVNILLFSILSPFFGINALFSDVQINTEKGRFNCRKKTDDISIFMGYDDSLDDFIDLQEGVFIDIGAHIGKFTVKVGRKLTGKVIAIELMPNNYERLIKNIKLNKLNNITPLNIGCSNSSGKVKVYGPLKGKGKVFYSLKKNEKNKLIDQLEVKPLDNLVKELKLKKVDLIKIDVEGVEKEVLEGAINTIQKFKPKIIFETNQSDFQEFVKFFNKYKYKIKRIDENNAIAEYNGKK